ncbi:hypothetical protein F5X96DRAFT_71220 [Biscogniauxia mediterranea]|nr:hypothetical protein F5X96DRAFT_71220 [Biscogniauxia mediterranea]
MSILANIGLFFILRGLYEVAWCLWAFFLRTSSIRSYLRTKVGKKPWALVTNASDGIGKGFAEKLAWMGFDIVLHDRDPYKLARTRAYLEQKFPETSFRTIIVNWQLCADGNHASFSEMKNIVSDINLKILINSPFNDAPDAYGPFDRYSPKHIADRVVSHAVFPTQVSSVLMRELLRNGPSLVINVVSTSQLGIPTRTSSMAFLMGSTVEFALESRVMRRDVEVMAVRAGQVAVNNNGGPFSPSVEKFVDAALAMVGCGRVIVVPYWTHVLQGWVAKLIPEPLSQLIDVELMKEEYRKSS